MKNGITFVHIQPPLLVQSARILLNFYVVLEFWFEYFVHTMLVSSKEVISEWHHNNINFIIEEPNQHHPMDKAWRSTWKWWMLSDNKTGMPVSNKAQFRSVDNVLRALLFCIIWNAPPLGCTGPEQIARVFKLGFSSFLAMEGPPTNNTSGKSVEDL